MSYVKHANIKILAFAILLLGILGYTLFQMQNVITGPVVSLLEPQNGATITDSLTEISGTARNISSISLNGRQISVDEHGAFQEKLLLSSGYNIITVRAKDKFGRETEKVVELVHTPNTLNTL